ncbi:hypothetical protein ACJX0J_016552, partial [Zea mays]
SLVWLKMMHNFYYGMEILFPQVLNLSTSSKPLCFLHQVLQGYECGYQPDKEIYEFIFVCRRAMDTTIDTSNTQMKNYAALIFKRESSGGGGGKAARLHVNILLEGSCFIAWDKIMVVALEDGSL